MNTLWIRWGSAFMFLGVALGAFGAHALKSKITPEAMEIYKTAVLYHLIHALGLFAIAWLSSFRPDGRIHWAGIFLVFGIIFFSGSLYLLAITGQKWLGALTPLGGVAFLMAWGNVFFSFLNQGR